MKKNFHPLGKVESEAIISKEIDGETKFFAFIAFDDKKSAEEAIKLNEMTMEEGEDNLYVGYAESKKKRKEKFKKQNIPFNQ